MVRQQQPHDDLLTVFETTIKYSQLDLEVVQQKNLIRKENPQYNTKLRLLDSSGPHQLLQSLKHWTGDYTV